MTRIPSATVDQGFYFLAVDAVDFVTPRTGLSAFTVRRSRNNGSSAAMTTPTVTEVDSANMPGWYFLLCDEDMTITSGNEAEEMAYHITCAGMQPVRKVIDLYDPLGYVYEASETGRDFMRLTRAALAGKADGLGTTTVHFRDIADAKNRITATVDADGNRTAVTPDAT